VIGHFWFEMASVNRCIRNAACLKSSRRPKAPSVWQSSG